jgi:hypothetical protein
VKRCGFIAAGAVIMAAALGLWIAFSARAQEAAHAELKDFKAALESFPPPNEMQPKTLLEGETAVPLTNGWFLLTGVKLQMYTTNGTLEMTAESPQCYFDSVTRLVTSSNHLQIQRADGSFIMEGDGFLLQQTNFNLIISNHVRTFIRYAPGQKLNP